MNEACGADGGGVSYEGQSAYDVADMLKQYFRDLPEPLLTSKLSETFLQIYQCKKTHTHSESLNKVLCGRPRAAAHACTSHTRLLWEDGVKLGWRGPKLCETVK